MADAAVVAQYVANGVVFGAVLALASIGLTLVYGILNLSNFAHGDLLTAGAFFAYLVTVDSPDLLLVLGVGIPVALAAWLLADRWRLRRLERVETLALAGFALALGAATAWALASPIAGRTSTAELAASTLVSVALVAALTVGVDLGVWRPLRKRRATLLTLVIVSIGVALVLRNLLQIRFGTGNRSFQRPSIVADRFLGVQMLPEQQFTLLAAAVLILAVHLWLKHSRYGKATRALADNLDLARATGIDVDRAILHVWILAGALAAVAGVLFALVANNVMNVNMGVNVLLALFASVILGGIGSAYGAMAGAMVVGVAMKTAPLWIGSRYETAAALVVLVVVLVVRPQGLFGGKA